MLAESKQVFHTIDTEALSLNTTALSNESSLGSSLLVYVPRQV